MMKRKVVVGVYMLRTLDGPEDEQGSIRWAIRRFVEEEVRDSRAGQISMQVIPLVVPSSALRLQGNSPVTVMVLMVWCTILS
jgi:hypothetical protein